MALAAIRGRASAAKRRHSRSIIGRFSKEENLIYDRYCIAGQVPPKVMVRRIVPWFAAVVASISALWWDQPWVVLYAFLMVVFAVVLVGALVSLAILGIGTHLAWMRGFQDARHWYENERTEIGADVNKIAEMHTKLAASLAYIGLWSVTGLAAAALGYAMPLALSPILFAVSVWAFAAVTLVGAATLHRMMMWVRAGSIRMGTANFGPYDATLDDELIDSSDGTDAEATEN